VFWTKKKKVLRVQTGTGEVFLRLKDIATALFKPTKEHGHVTLYVRGCSGPVEVSFLTEADYLFFLNEIEQLMGRT